MIKYIALALAFLIAIIGHEIMHGLMAKYYGDDSAYKEGRLSINPIKHIDLVGSILFPIALFVSQKIAGVTNPIVFGWAKPVPVNMFKVIQKGGYIGAFFVSIAGVVFNLCVAFIAGSILMLFMNPNDLFEAFIMIFLFYLIFINSILAVFNLWPIPPLDGANGVKFLALQFNLKSIVSFYNKIEPYGMVILLIILFTPISDYLFKPAYMLVSLILG